MPPADGHVHTEWSWDAPSGSMEQTCVRALELGLPAVAFTDHADYTRWPLADADLDEDQHLRRFTDELGVLTPPRLDAEGYLESIERCRARFPDLHILSGVELGEPHWHSPLAAALLRSGEFDRVLGSLHCLPMGEGFAEPPYLYQQRPAAEVMGAYLLEVPRLVAGFGDFAVLAHIDYPVRTWPANAGPFDVTAFEGEFRQALKSLADSGRALEVNTGGPLQPEVVRWWREEGGAAVTFGSDAHDPTGLAFAFTEAAAMVEAAGFRAGRHPFDFCLRS